MPKESNSSATRVFVRFAELPVDVLEEIDACQRARIDRVSALAAFIEATNLEHAARRGWDTFNEEESERETFGARLPAEVRPAIDAARAATGMDGSKLVSAALVAYRGRIRQQVLAGIRALLAA